MELPAHLLTLATLRLLTLDPSSRFTHVRQIPLNILSQLTARYLELLAIAVKRQAEQAGRTTPSARDVVEAINEFGLQLPDIWDWCDERRLGGEGVQMARSGPVDPSSLGDLLKSTPKPEPSQILEYAPSTSRPLPDHVPIHLPPPPPQQYIDPLAFLPPIPDLSASLQEQTIVEEGRTVKRARRAVETGKSSWQRPIAYENSTMLEYETKPLPNVDEIQLAIDDNTPSSLLYFLETFNYVSLDAAEGELPLPLRQNKLRKRAAMAIHSNILNPSDDSLSGAIPIPQPRHARKQAGWIPYPPLGERADASEPTGKAVQPFPPLHPFNTALPAAITENVPSFILPHPSRILAPTMHPRYPTAVSSIRTLLEQTQSSLFNRTTRLGPPGPLLDNGAAGHYEVELERPVIPNWSGDTAPRMMSWNFDWEVGNETGDGVKDRQTASTPAINVLPSVNAGPAFPALPARQIREPVVLQPVEPIPMEALPPMPLPVVQELEPAVEPIATMNGYEGLEVETMDM